RIDFVYSAFSANTSLGDYTFEVQTVDRCGDGVVGVTEVCDDGNQFDGDGCSADCRTIEVGYSCVYPGMPCDPTFCGDGIVGGGEECEPSVGGVGCSSACTVEPGWACPADMPCHPMTCGDGIIDPPETCDDFGMSIGSGCSSTCDIEFLDPAGADSNIVFGFTFPVGRWVQTSTTNDLRAYMFSAQAGTTYAIESFVGAPYACQLGSIPRIAMGVVASIFSTSFPGLSPLESDVGYDLDCPRILWTAPVTEDVLVWVVPVNGGTLDPLYVSIQEVP
ncbi:MAG TPA: DUF4215 domain-containing protein, partial [Vulgatibacter sp.]